MGSLGFTAPPEIYRSKRCALLGNFDYYNLWILHPTVSFSVSRNKFEKPLKPSNSCNLSRNIVANAHGPHLATDLVDESEADNNCAVALVDESLIVENPDVDSKLTDNYVARKSGRKIWRRVSSMNKAARTKGSKPVLIKKGHSFDRVRDGGKVHVDISCIRPESSVEHCNSILKNLEKNSDEKTVEFFEWMKSNGKLKKNSVGYNLCIRALARKEDWSKAKLLLQEMTSESGCELTPQVFNALIFVCAKRGLVRWGVKWFHMMLEKGVQPDVATIGMLMGLYQRSGNLSQAELTFAQMRNLKLHCISGYSAMITIYTRLGLYEKAEKIISLMEEDGVLPNLENWLVRLNAYSQQGKLEKAESVLKAMLESGCSPDIVAYNMLITGYGKVSNTKSAHDLFQSLRGIGLEPDETTYRSMIEGFGRADEYKEAKLYYEELKSLGFQPSSSNFYTMINLQARHGDKEGVVQTLKDMRGMGCQYSSILSSLLQAFERVGRINDIPLILEPSFYENILHDSTSCSILVMAYVQNFLMDEALKVLQEKKWEDSDFEDSLYHLLICSCKEGGHFENAVRIYTQMPKSQSSPNLHIACSMIDIYSAMNRFTDAENLYLKLKASEVTFDLIAYSIVVRMYIKAGSLKDACLVLDMIDKRNSIVPDAFLFRDMLRTYQQCGMLKELESAYYWILKSGIKWDEAMYNCVINCCGHALPVDEVSRIFKEMIQCGYAANTITFNVMIDIYGKAGFLNKAWKILEMARKQGLEDVISYNTIIAAYGQRRDLDSMQYVIQRMQHEGYKVSLEAYNCMLDAYGKEDLLEEFNDILQKMKESRCSSDHYTYNIMINIYGKKGWIEEVSRVLAELKEHGLEPDLYSYNTVIKAYGIAGMVEEAVNVMQEMRAKGINPDRITYSNLISALQRNENFLEAVKWSLWMKQIGTPA